MLSLPKSCLWLILELATRDFVGLCGFLSDSRIPNFIYSVAENKQRQGFCFEAVSAAIQVGGKILGTNEVELNIHSENTASLRIAEKLGFRLELQYEHPYP
jgi:RimJ/RimL family protein N-acetyltransferase